ncbi:MAG: hypothetical protein LUH21_04340 [Clostridiales bacterium]|nr:hypothetical protein [Clostridiales bacterium]
MEKILSNIIVNKDLLCLNNRQFLLVKIANCDLKIGDICKDNLGNVFTIISSVHYKFVEDIPEWYLKTPQYYLEGETDNIGDYLIKILLD